MSKSLRVFLFMFFITLNGVCVFGQSNLEYLYLDFNSSEQTNKVSYGISNLKNQEYVFEMNMYYNNEKYEKSCNEKISSKEDTIYNKITCQIQKLGDGEYTFEGNLYEMINDEKILITKTIDKEYIYLEKSSNIKFISNEEDQTTTIIIEVNGDKPVQVINTIPKSVIELLTEENQENLIKSNYEYEIIEADPVIAWNIEEPPGTINYTINKKISTEEQKEFQIEIKDDPAFKFIKYGILVLILVILLLLFRPILKK